MNYLTYNGETSESFGVYIGGQGTYNAPVRDVTKVSVPGRNGDLIKDNGRFLNVSVSYPVVVIGDFADKVDLINSWLKSPATYCRLEDTYHPDYYRMAMAVDGIVYETGAWNRSGKGVITFDCKPQKWLKTGETAVTLSASGTISNPTKFNSRPLIKVKGTGAGTVTVNNQVITIDSINTYTDIDCETMDCHKGTANRNSYVHLGGMFPELKPGSNSVSFAGGVTSVVITGRWWTV